MVGLLGPQPAGGIGDAVHATGSAQGVASGDGLIDPWKRRYGQAGADRVAGTQQGAQVAAVQGPQRGGDEVPPAAVGTGPSSGS